MNITYDIHTESIAPEKGQRHIHVARPDAEWNGIERNTLAKGLYGYSWGGYNFICIPKKGECKKCKFRYKCWTTITLLIEESTLFAKLSTNNITGDKVQIMKEYLQDNGT